MIKFFVAIVPLLLGAFSVPAPAAADYKWTLPAWAPKPVVPADNAMSVAKIALGRRLFYEKRLSSTGDYACASCHQQAKAFTDGRVRAAGATGEALRRNTPSLANVAYMPRLTWADPGLDRLETQMRTPLFNRHPVELGLAGKEAAILKMFQADESYPAQFRAAFPAESSPVSLKNMRAAIAAFERTLVSFNSAYDRYREGNEPDAISAEAKQGEALFFSERLNCFQCHQWPLFSDSGKRGDLPFEDIAFHNIGLYHLDSAGAYPAEDTGLHDVTGQAGDMGRFRTPSLRNVAVTAPYFHDGSAATLDQVIEIYAAGGRNITTGPLAGDGRRNPHKSVFIRAFNLTPAEKLALIAFLNSLTDETFLTNPAFGPPPAK